ncbi:aminoglycoside phosphotransferase family protein [Rossellomorea oryzaecorticis]|uniref:Aminoglycoside phosphotransferase family protein n=1 Tax=Rossellomorea oryzaecorticis TaxID=1396505 RepID=A0ABU9K919_9BACI
MKLGNPIASGNTAVIYLHENNIIKVLKDYLPDGESEYEANKQKYAHSCGLSVPEIISVTKIGDKQAIIMEYVKGKTVGEIAAGENGKAAYYLSLSVDIQLKIHSKTADSIEPMREKLIRQIVSTGKLSQIQKKALMKKLESMAFENRLCHGDFHLNNLIMSDDNVTIIDWIDSSSGDIRADVYRTYLLYSQVSSEVAELYLRLYCQKSGLSKEEILEWAPIIAGARLSENVSSENNERLIEIVNNG